MNSPTFKPGSSWFTPNNDKVKRATIQTIDFVDSYLYAGELIDSWDASINQDGSIICYVDEENKLTISGNGTGSIMASEDCSYAFSGMTNLTSIRCGVLNTTNTINMAYMFGDDSPMKISSILFGHQFHTDKVQNMRGMFKSCSSLFSLNLSNFNTSSCFTMECMFDGCSRLRSLYCSGFNTYNVTNMRNMFRGCSILATIKDIANWDVSHVIDMQGMFHKCKKLVSLDVSKWDTSSCTNMAFMLCEASSLTSIDFENWNVSKVKSFDHFLAHSTNMVKFDISKWNVTSACKNLYAAFHSTNVASIDVTNWDVSNVIAFGKCFKAMSQLTEIKGLNTWNTASGIDFAQMFNNCSNLKILDLSSFDMTKAKVDNTIISLDGSTAFCTMKMFDGLSNLEKIVLSDKFTLLGDGTAPAEAIGFFPSSKAKDACWKTAKYIAYAPTEIPSLTSEIYYATLEDVENVQVMISNKILKDIANAIRLKTGYTGQLYPKDFALLIEKL